MLGISRSSIEYLIGSKDATLTGATRAAADARGPDGERDARSHVVQKSPPQRERVPRAETASAERRRAKPPAERERSERARGRRAIPAPRSEPLAQSTCSSTVPGSASSDGGGSAGSFAAVVAAAAAAAAVVVVVAAAAGGGSGGVTGGVTSAGGACGGARLRHASSCAQAALPALTQIAESASATVAASRSTDGSMLVPIISTIKSISPGGPPEVSRPIKQKPLTWKWAHRCVSVMVICVPAAWPMREVGAALGGCIAPAAWREDPKLARVTKNGRVRGSDHGSRGAAR